MWAVVAKRPAKHDVAAPGERGSDPYFLVCGDLWFFDVRPLESEQRADTAVMIHDPGGAETNVEGNVDSFFS